VANSLENLLRAIARFQVRHTYTLAVFIVLFTLALGAGLSSLTVNSDIKKEMPTGLPIYRLNDRVSDKFGGEDTVVIAARIDENVNSRRAVRDIRDPRVTSSLAFLEESLKGENGVTSIVSPLQAGLFSRDYRTTLMYVRADLGGSEEKIQGFSRMLEEKVEYTPKPPGLKFSLTGLPLLRVSIFELLKRDAVFTLAVSSVLILLLLWVMQRSVGWGLLVFGPLSLGLIWTMGTLGWLGIPLSIATVGLSSMILGLGVEYGVFVVTRYREERDKGVSKERALETAVHGVGSAITGSGLTTIVGFGVLSFASIPMMQHLGQTLALGIAYSLLAAIVANPVFILLAERHNGWQKKPVKLERSGGGGEV